MLLLMAMSFGAMATPPAAQRIDAARVVAAARAQIDARLGGDRDKARVTVVGMPEDITAPPGPVALTVRPLAGRWPRARVGVPVDIDIDGHVARSATVWFAIEMQGSVLSYAEDTPIGSAAAAVRLSPSNADIALLQGTPLADPHEVENMRLRRPALAGAVAVREDFERLPDVDRQGRVQVMLKFGSIQMQTQGTAASKGNAGDLVAVLVDNAESPVRARVTDKGVVEVVQ